MKRTFLLWLFTLWMFIPLFAETSTPPPSAWKEWNPVSQQQWIEYAWCTTWFLNSKSCDYTGEPMKLRKDYEYEFADEFWAWSESDSEIMDACTNIHEEWDYNNGINPIFDYTQELRNANWWVKKNTSMIILKANKLYQIKNLYCPLSCALRAHERWLNCHLRLISLR